MQTTLRSHTHSSGPTQSLSLPVILLAMLVGGGILGALFALVLGVI